MDSFLLQWQLWRDQLTALPWVTHTGSTDEGNEDITERNSDG